MDIDEAFYNNYETVLNIYDFFFVNEVFFVHTSLLMLGCQHSYLMVLRWLQAACRVTKKSQNIVQTILRSQNIHTQSQKLQPE